MVATLRVVLDQVVAPTDRSLSEASRELARALVERADIVLEGFRPGVAARLGVGPDVAPESTVYCSITGFGTEGPHAARAGHDLNYLGWAGVLEDTAPGLPPLQPAGRVSSRPDHSLEAPVTTAATRDLQAEALSSGPHPRQTARRQAGTGSTW